MWCHLSVGGDTHHVTDTTGDAAGAAPPVGALAGGVNTGQGPHD